MPSFVIVQLAVHKFDTKVNRSYQCESKQEFVNMTGTQSAPELHQLTLRNMQVEAFSVTSSAKFSSRESY